MPLYVQKDKMLVYVVLLFCYFDGNSDYMHSVDEDVRYKIYMRVSLLWIIPSKYQSHESVNWTHTTGFVKSAYNTLLDASFHARLCMLTTQFSIHAFSSQIYRYTCVCLCTLLGFILLLVRLLFWQPLDLHVKILELGPWTFLSLIKVAQRKRSRPVIDPFLPAPPVQL